MTDHTHSENIYFYPGRLNPPKEISLEMPGLAPTGNLLCFLAYGRHFIDMGIVDGSILLCELGAQVNEGDLAIVYLNGNEKHLCCKLVCADPKFAPDGIPILSASDRIAGKVLATVNRYQ